MRAIVGMARSYRGMPNVSPRGMRSCLGRI